MALARLSVSDAIDLQRERLCTVRTREYSPGLLSILLHSFSFIPLIRMYFRDVLLHVLESVLQASDTRESRFSNIF